MSKSLRSMKDKERTEAIERRLREKKGGCGYWAAVDARNQKPKDAKGS